MKKSTSLKRGKLPCPLQRVEAGAVEQPVIEIQPSVRISTGFSNMIRRLTKQHRSHLRSRSRFLPGKTRCCSEHLRKDQYYLRLDSVSKNGDSVTS